MVLIYPFNGLFYNIGKIEDPSLVVTQPYDKIDDKLQEVYYNRHPYNLVRIIRGKDHPSDTPVYNKYTRALELFSKWQMDKIIIKDHEPCIYPYHQIYKSPQGYLTRKGFVALIELEELDKGKILPHEETHIKPIQDRLALLHTTGAYFEQIFMLYSEPDGVINKIMDECISNTEPFIKAQDDFGESHKLWRISNFQRIKQIQDILRDKEVIIADGHHRYTSAWLYAQEKKLSKAKVMATLINMDDPGLFIFPTHRLIYGIDFDISQFLSQVQKFFDIITYSFSDSEEEQFVRTDFLEDLRITKLDQTTIGIVAHNINKYFLLKLKDKKLAAQEITENKSFEWKTLDVNILHKLILEKILGITSDDLAQEKYVAYFRYAEEVIAKVKEHPAAKAGFLLNPVRIDQIKKIVKNRERFPQKTTDFYPKLLSGVVMALIE